MIFVGRAGHVMSTVKLKASGVIDYPSMLTTTSIVKDLITVSAAM